MDLNFSEGGGDISYYLNIPRSPNILNFLNGYSKEALDNSIIRINKNLHILQPPPTFDQSKKIELQDIYCITDIAKKRYHILIIDLPNHLGDLWLGAIDLADLLILISDLSGESNVLAKAEEFNIKLKKGDATTKEIVTALKELESQGYQFEGAEGSFELLIKKAVGRHKKFFDLLGFRVIVEGE